MDAPVREGDVLAAKYRVERILGIGGMGVVVAAQHLQLRQRVALKLLRPEICEEAMAVERFLREARAAVQIQSEHVARVSDVGTLENGAPYMVMEYLQGHDLAEVLRTRGPLPIAAAVEYVLQACEAIAEAHSLGIVHRDLKPANLFLTRRADGSALVKVLDFGISKARLVETPDTPANMTVTKAVMGSPMYMSPEQVRSARNVDARTDVWALGVILHELVSNKTVYQAETMSGLLAMIVADPPTPLRTHKPDAPEELERVILRCLEKDPQKRVQSVGELAQELGSFASPRAQLSIERILGVLHPRESAPLSSSSEQPAPKEDALAQHTLTAIAAERPELPVPKASSARASAPAQTELAAAAAQTGRAWGNTARGHAKRRGGPLAALMGGVAVIAAMGAWFLRGASDKRAIEPADLAASPTSNEHAVPSQPPHEPAIPPDPNRDKPVATASPEHDVTALEPAPEASAPSPSAPTPVSVRASASTEVESSPRQPSANGEAKSGEPKFKRPRSPAAKSSATIVASAAPPTAAPPPTAPATATRPPPPDPNAAFDERR